MYFHNTILIIKKAPTDRTISRNLISIVCWSSNAVNKHYYFSIATTLTIILKNVRILIKKNVSQKYYD